MQLEPITDKQRWEAVVSTFPEANFLQSWNWGVFQQSLSKQVTRLAVLNQNKVVGLFQTVLEPASRGPYLSIAGGPLLDWHQAEVVAYVFAACKQLAKEQGAWFIRFRPQEVESVALEQTVAAVGARSAPMHLTADLTLQLQLAASEDELLAQMRKNHRNLIRRAERDGITTTVSQDSAEIQQFYDWQCYLAEKHGFVPFSKRFLRNQFEAFAADDQVLLIHSFMEDQLLASAFVIFYNGEAIYHYGISTPTNEKIPGSYAVQWRAIQEAKARGCQRYNFWGIAPEQDKNHRFAGVSMFKRGFGGQEVAYLAAHDVPVSPLYWGTYVFEQLRRRYRKL